MRGHPFRFHSCENACNDFILFHAKIEKLILFSEEIAG